MGSEAATRTALLVPLKKLHHFVRHLFPTQGSLDWEIRNHRREYIAGAAMILMAGRYLVDVAMFQEIALRKATRAAAEAAGVPVPAAPALAMSLIAETREEVLRGVINRAKPFAGCSGVYFLTKGSDVVYVGQSRNVFSRVHDHRRADVDFDGWTYEPCRESDLLAKEREYIELLQPRLNIAGNARGTP